AVLTGEDLRQGGLQPVPTKSFSWHPAEIPLHNSDGSLPFHTPERVLPIDKTRYAGEAVAMVVAETLAAAKDGAERVIVDYEPLAGVGRAVDPVKPGAPRLHQHHASNLCIDAQVGDARTTAAAFARAAHVAKITTWVPRVAGSPMEPRAAIGDYDSATGR